MPTFARRIQPAIQAELDAAAAAEASHQLDKAFRHLERAHILGQPATAAHVRVHLRMLGFAIRHRLGGEAVGQLWRLAGAAVFTAIGLVPEGNTGGTNVNGFRRMEIPADLRWAIALARIRA